MPNPTDPETLHRLLQWAGEHDEWRKRRVGMVAAHFGLLQGDLKMPLDEVAKRLGPVAKDVMVCAIEDLLTQRFGDRREQNVVDEYLADRGRLEEEHAVSYLRAVQGSTPSLYEVVSVAPGRTVTVRDLVRETDPEEVPDRMVSKSETVSDCFVSRLVGSGPTRRFSAGVLPFPREWVPRFMEELIEHTKDFTKRLREAGRTRGQEVDISELDARVFVLRSPTGAMFFSQRFVTRCLEALDAGRGGLQNAEAGPRSRPRSGFRSRATPET